MARTAVRNNNKSGEAGTSIELVLVVLLWEALCVKKSSCKSIVVI